MPWYDVSSGGVASASDSSEPTYTSQSENFRHHRQSQDYGSMRSQMMDAISRLNSQDGDDTASSSSSGTDVDQTQTPAVPSKDNAAVSTEPPAKLTLKLADLLGLKQNVITTDAEMAQPAASGVSSDSSAKSLASVLRAGASIPASGVTTYSKSSAGAKATPRTSHSNSERDTHYLPQLSGSEAISQPLLPLQLPKKDSAGDDDLSSALTSAKRQGRGLDTETSKVNSESVSLDSANQAFDMKITGDGTPPNAHSSSAVQGVPVSSPVAILHQSAAIRADVTPAGRADHESAHSPEQGLFAESTTDLGSENLAAGANAAGQVSAAPAPTEIDTPNPGLQGEPVRNVHMQLSGDNNQRVDVRFFDQGGELRVNVKASDPTLARNLQEHIPDLTGRLAQERFKAEVWTPTAGASQTSEANNNQSFQQNQDGNNAHQGRQQRDNSNENQPNWWLESDD